MADATGNFGVKIYIFGEGFEKNFFLKKNFFQNIYIFSKKVFFD
jgi:hypothetical protein